MKNGTANVRFVPGADIVINGRVSNARTFILSYNTSITSNSSAISSISSEKCPVQVKNL